LHNYGSGFCSSKTCDSCTCESSACNARKPANPSPAKPATPAPATPAAEPAATTKSNAVALDLFQLMRGIIASENDVNFIQFINISASYERLIVPHFSIGADLDLYFIDLGPLDSFYFAIAAEGRYYPMSNFDKLFLGTTIGFHLYSVDGGAPNVGHGGFNGLTMSLKMGYKVTIGILYLEPYIAYVLSKDELPSFDLSEWNGGLRLGFTF